MTIKCDKCRRRLVDRHGKILVNHGKFGAGTYHQCEKCYRRQTGRFESQLPLRAGMHYEYAQNRNAVRRYLGNLKDIRGVSWVYGINALDNMTYPQHLRAGYNFYDTFGNSEKEIMRTYFSSNMEENKATKHFFVFVGDNNYPAGMENLVNHADTVEEVEDIIRSYVNGHNNIKIKWCHIINTAGEYFNLSVGAMKECAFVKYWEICEKDIGHYISKEN